MPSKQAEDPVMVKVRAKFEASGLSLHELGLRMGYPEESARKSAWQFIQKTDDPRLSMLRRFSEALDIPFAELASGAHKSQTLASGAEVHLIKHPGSDQWKVNSYDWSWVEGQMLHTAQVFAQNVGWQDKGFDTADEAFSFVEQQIKKGKAPRPPKK